MEGFRIDILMTTNGLDNFLLFPITTGQICRYLYMVTRHLMSDRSTDIVQ